MKVFKEEQRFTQWWVYILFLSINSMCFYRVYLQFILKIPFRNKPMSNLGIIITTILLLLTTILFFSLKLKTKIDETGIYYRFYPIQLKNRKKKWKDIESVKVMQFRPILDYGGWGIKHGSYTVKGNKGFQLKLKNGKKLLIGTQKKEEVTRVLKEYKNKLL